jgi:hypothetical protein
MNLTLQQKRKTEARQKWDASEGLGGLQGNDMVAHEQRRELICHTGQNLCDFTKVKAHLADETVKLQPQRRPG